MVTFMLYFILYLLCSSNELVIENSYDFDCLAWNWAFNILTFSFRCAAAMWPSGIPSFNRTMTLSILLRSVCVEKDDPTQFSNDFNFFRSVWNTSMILRILYLNGRLKVPTSTLLSMHGNCLITNSVPLMLNRPLNPRWWKKCKLLGLKLPQMR